MRTMLLFLAAASPLVPSNLVALELSLTASPAVPDEFRVGESLKFELNLSGVNPGQELAVLAATVSLDGGIFGQPLISSGDIIPQPLCDPLDFVRSSDTGLTDATFLTFSPNQVHHIGSDGTFYTFEVRATAEGQSNIAIDYLYAALFDRTNPNEPIPLPITPSQPIQVQILPPQLQAGDADQDLDFDQLDLVKVSVPFLYRTGQPATWGQGDWNGAPGGSVGSPPAGDGVFDQWDIIAALRTANYLAGPYAARSPKNSRQQSQSALADAANTEELTVETSERDRFTSASISPSPDVFVAAQGSRLAGSLFRFGFRHDRVNGRDLRTGNLRVG